MGGTAQIMRRFQMNITDTGAKNIVIPDGTEVSVEYGSITLTPSEVYYDVDYTEYYIGINFKNIL